MVGVWDGMKLGWIPTDEPPSQSYPNIPMIRRCSTILPFCVETTDCKTPSAPKSNRKWLPHPQQERSICSDSSAAAAAGEEFYRSHLCHDLHLHHLHLQPSSCALIEVLVVRERHFKGGPSFLWSSSSSPLTIFICVGWSAGEERAFPFFLKMPFLPSSSQISQ